MKVSLNVSDDQELRAAVKDVIKGQAMSIVRTELTDIIRQELERKVKGYSTNRFDKILKEAMKEVIKTALYEKHSVSEWSTAYIQPYVQQIIEPAVIQALKRKNWNQMVDDLAKAKVKALIN